MNVDIIGLENILKYIEATKLSKFQVFRAGANNKYTPVFECLSSDSNPNAVNEFRKWAEVVNNNTPYTVVLFDFCEVIDNGDGKQTLKKGGTRMNKMESTFIINTGAGTYQANQTTPQTTNFGGDLATLRSDIINEISKKHEESAILNEIKLLTKKVQELEEEEDEEEEQEAGMIAGLKPDQIQQLMGLIGMFKQPASPPVINGVDEVKDNINKAIKILYKHDKNLDTDLLKLADLAENKPDTFNFLLSSLRTM